MSKPLKRSITPFDPSVRHTGSVKTPRDRTVRTACPRTGPHGLERFLAGGVAIFRTAPRAIRKTVTTFTPPSAGSPHKRFPALLSGQTKRSPRAFCGNPRED